MNAETLAVLPLPVIGAQPLAIGLPFGVALSMLKQGRLVARKEWKAGTHLFLISMDTGPSPIVVTRAGNDPVRPWDTVASDVLAEDWVLLDHRD